MATQKFDELNNFFKDMELPQTEKNKRIKLAELLIDVFLYLFMLVEGDLKGDRPIDRDFYISTIEPRFIKALNSYEDKLIENYPDLKEYPRVVVTEIVDTTIAHIIPIETKDDGTVINEVDSNYFISEDRALTIGKNEANTVGNAVLQAKAIEQGYTDKMWVTMQDELVRGTHIEAEGQTVGINENFTVGGYEMPYPRYYLAPAEETVNCRCTVKYL